MIIDNISHYCKWLAVLFLTQFNNIIKMTCATSRGYQFSGAQNKANKTKGLEWLKSTEMNVKREGNIWTMLAVFDIAAQVYLVEACVCVHAFRFWLLGHYMAMLYVGIGSTLKSSCNLNRNTIEQNKWRSEELKKEKWNMWIIHVCIHCSVQNAIHMLIQLHTIPVYWYIAIHTRINIGMA